MDNWGRGPWFEPEENADDATPDADGADGADGAIANESEDEGDEQPTIVRRPTGGPKMTLPPLPGAVSRPLPREPGSSGSWGPLAGEGMAGAPFEQGTPEVPGQGLGVPGQAPGEGGSFRRQSMPSRPLAPGGPPDASGEARLWGEAGAPGASGGFGYSVSATPSRPLVPPVPDSAGPGPAGFAGSMGIADPFGPMAPPWNDTITPAGAPPRRIPPGRAKRGDGGDRRRRLVAWPLLIGLVVLIIACSAIGLYESGLLGGNSPKAAGSTQHPAATATATANVPTAATLSLSPASQQVNSPGQMTSCPSGCDLTGQTDSKSQPFSVTNAASLVPQTALFGNITVKNTGTTTWSDPAATFSGTYQSMIYTCAAQPVTLGPGQTNSLIPCFIGVASPSSLPAGTIQGTVPGTNSKVTYSQPAALPGNAHYEVQPQDCQSALNTAHSQGSSWAQGWIAGQTIPAGWQWARSQALVGFTGDTCSPSVATQSPNPFNFTASTTASVQNSAYNPAAAQSLAASRRDGMLPSGYQWKGGSRSTCTPSVSGVASNGKVTLTCSEGGTAVYIWSDTQSSALASKVAGQSKTKALSICNGWTGVRSGSCAITIQGGDGTLLPSDPKTVTVTVGAP
jgi:hypothetical protein